MNYQTENRHHNAQKNVVKGTGEYNTDNGCETCTPKKRNKEALRQVNREKQRGKKMLLSANILTFGKYELAQIHWYQFWAVKFPPEIQNM